MRIKSIGYARVSTGGQVRDGVSMDMQRARFEAWSEANDADLLEVFTDAGMSGARASNRPGLLAAIKAARKHRAALIVYSLSRLARNVVDAIRISDDLHRAGADLVSLTEKIDTTSAAGRVFFTIMAAMAEFERGQIAERTAAAMAHLRKQGRRISGRIPYGFDLAEDGRNLVENQAEREAVELMRRLRSEGLSLRKIVAELDRRSIPTKSGVQWSAQVVRGILRREAA